MITLEQRLKQGVGRKTVVMTHCFPFFLVGILKSVNYSYIVVEPIFGVPIQLKNVPFRIAMDAIAAIFPEEKKGQIPDMENWGKT